MRSRYRRLHAVSIVNAPCDGTTWDAPCGTQGNLGEDYCRARRR